MYVTVNAMNSDESDESGTEVQAKKRKAESSDESDYKPKSTQKKRRGSSSGSEDWNEKKKKKSGPKAKYTGFTRPYTLSPDLAALMGAKELPRHEVVKKVWAIIKEKNLYDPKNKQYAICDGRKLALNNLKVFIIRRFSTFSIGKSHWS